MDKPFLLGLPKILQLKPSYVLKVAARGVFVGDAGLTIG
jgi:hypothetical protein